VFERAASAECHAQPLYSNNKLTPARGFNIPEGHRNQDDILPLCVGTNPDLTMNTRRGTGYYKVPSLKGVWYRGMFEHSGSVATLEDWFDPRRLRDDYQPTGFKGYGVKSRAVPGHEFGLNLSSEDRRALVAFLKKPVAVPPASFELKCLSNFSATGLSALPARGSRLSTVPFARIRIRTDSSSSLRQTPMSVSADWASKK
jgi:hypothetical protein